VKAHLAALRECAPEFAAAYESLNRLAARVLAKDTAGMLAELGKLLEGKKAKANAMGSNA
jgi:hypothetical protein